MLFNGNRIEAQTSAFEPPNLDESGENIRARDKKKAPMGTRGVKGGMDMGYLIFGKPEFG